MSSVSKALNIKQNCDEKSKIPKDTIMLKPCLLENWITVHQETNDETEENYNLQITRSLKNLNKWNFMTHYFTFLDGVGRLEPWV